uniref:Me53 n=1 Tax=Erinnyis ello granulovirus TaxID=307444 RepID=A0A288WIH1_9BBAC|nr:me53 [Erinnyis ello granulovirus]
MCFCYNMSSTTDLRINFLSKETKEVINSVVGITQRLLLGSDDTCCAFCTSSFKHTTNTVTHTKFIFLVVVNYHTIADDTLKFCCLQCTRKQFGVMDVIELHPTVKLHSIKKLMYFNLIRKLLFYFKDTQVVHYKKYVVINSLDDVLQQVVSSKEDHHEILRLRLVKEENNEIVAENIVDDMKIVYGNVNNKFMPQYRFDAPLSFNKQLITTVNNECQRVKYYMEVFYKEYEKFTPFVVYYDKGVEQECLHCVNKIDEKSGHPVMYCSVCGPTNPNYFSKHKTMIKPFWRDTNYDHKKLYWKWCAARKKFKEANLMLYAYNAKRDVP